MVGQSSMVRASDSSTMNSSNGSQSNEQITTMVVGSPGGLLTASDDDDDNCPSSPGSAYAEGADLMAAAMGDEVTAQLAAAGMLNKIMIFDLLDVINSTNGTKNDLLTILSIYFCSLFSLVLHLHF